MRELQPQVVLTFDPIGGYRHPDHIAIQRATVMAFEQAGNPGFTPDCPPTTPPQRMYFHTFPHGFLKLLVKLLPLVGKDPHRWGSNGDVDLAAIAEVSFPVHARIDIRPVLNQKRSAGACHASQGGGRMGGSLTSWILSLIDRSESFMRAVPPPHAREKIERDLFQAVR
jgi:LmbE family N-acetylglucosaminyl deacetylase